MGSENEVLQCNAYCLAKHFAFDRLKAEFGERYRTTLHRDVLHVELDGNAFVFDFGVVVFWGMSHDNEQRLMDSMVPYLQIPFEEPLFDHFTYTPDCVHNRLHEDHIELKGDDSMGLLAVSHGIAQSLELNELENSAEKSISDTASIPQNIARTGSSHMRSRDIAKMRGRLFLVQSEINLHHALMETPDFFWEYPEWEELYLMTAKYLEVRSRTDVLNKKLSVIHELFDMLADEQKHRHSSVLEWIIIWLIAFEILMFLLHDMLKIV